MPIIGYESAGFPAPLNGLNGGGSMPCTWVQLAWAAITVGKAFGDEAQYGFFSTFERIHRVSMLFAYLFESPSGRLLKADPYLAADPSEKANISYSLGMTLAKLYSELYLATPRLLHYAVYSGGYNITTGAGGSRPDLIGQTTAGEWVVFEAKGRSNALESGVLAAAKTQSTQIESIGGLTPFCRVGFAAYFSQDGLRFAVEDPIANGTRKIEISPDTFLERYDASLRQLIRTRASASRRIEGHLYTGTEYSEADIFLSLVGESNHAINRMVAEDRQLTEAAYLGNDGLLVELGPSWRETKMRQQPQLR